MLIVRRHAGEGVTLQLADGQQIEVQVIETGATVALGVTAPAQVGIWRTELLAAVARNNQEAAQVRLTDLESILRRRLVGQRDGEGDG